MKKILALLLFFCTGIMLQAGDSRVYNEDMGKRMNEQMRQSNVRTITGYTFSYSGGVLSKESYKSSVEVFDRKGNKTEDAVYGSDGESSESFLYTYNDQGIELKNVGMRLHKPVFNYWAYELIDSLSALKKYHSLGKNKEYWLTQYDSKGRRSMEYYYSHEGYMDHSKEYIYEKGSDLLIEKRHVDSYGNLYSKWIYKYDEAGNNTEIIQYDQQGNIFMVSKHSFDSKNNITASTLTDGKGNALRMTVYMYEYY